MTALHANALERLFGMESAKPILLVDDEEGVLYTTRIILRQAGIENVRLCMDSREVMPMVASEAFDAVILDLTMPYRGGEELLPEIHGACPDLPVIVMTGLNQLEVAVRCMKAGAFDYMVKPVEPMRLIAGVRHALDVARLREEYDAIRRHMLADDFRNPDAFRHIVSSSPKIAKLLHYIDAVAPGRRPVLITGETGAGKELFARAVHLASGRTGPFVVVNAAGLDDHVFSDTLFGHTKGAFTGADRVRPGLVAQAAGGTLFLDEFGDLSLPSQVKLLRLLQNDEYFPLGSDTPTRSEARIVAATNRDLAVLSAEGRFREDLYYRLQSHRIHIPPLRERLEDLPALLDRMLELASLELGKKKPRPPQELLTLLATYHFPGNVRELEAMVYDAVSHHTDRMLSMTVFQERIAAARPPEGGGVVTAEANGAAPFQLFAELPTLKNAQNLLIDEALRRSQGNQTLAAQLLGISQSGLSKALKRLGEQAG